MATSKILVFLFAILVSATTILAQETTASSGSNGDDNAPASSSASGIFPFHPIHFDLSAFWPQFSSLASHAFGSRQKRSPVEVAEIEEHSRQKRNVIRCNYASEGGFKCTGCRQARRCYPFGLGTVTTCGGFLPYCNNGFCSTIKGPLCSTTTTTTTTSTTSSSTSSSGTSSSGTSSSSSSGSSESG